MPRWLSLYGSCLFFGLATIGYAEKPHFSEGVAGGGSLKVRDTVAVLSLSGTPAEIGEEEARLVAKQASTVAELRSLAREAAGGRNGLEGPGDH